MYLSGKINTKYIVLIVLIVLIILVYYIKTLFNKKYAFLSKDTENFDSKVDKLVLYYAEWCGWSQKILPVWDELEKEILPVKLEKINCEENKEMCKKIEGYPTIILENKNKNKMMDGQYERTIEGIKKFITDNIK
jgi:thiol-disulfide isomerase/thioredoxin